MPIVLSEAASGAMQSVSRNDRVVLQLPENPTTGYRWEVQVSGEGELALVADNFITGAGGEPPGAGGQRKLEFVARKPGNVRIDAVNRRSWETAAPTQQKSFALRVV